MTFGNLGGRAENAVLCFGSAALLLALAGWSGGAGAVPMQTEGAFSVQPDGTADYSVPIAVPPGTAGMAPSISLNYSSANGDGVLGSGWSLGGLASINRCPETIAQDGQSIGVSITGTDVNGNATDRYCYGGQRLIAIGYYNGGTEYRTEIDGISRIVSQGTEGNGPQYFLVYTKSGQIQEFGNTPDSNIQAIGANGPIGTARAWALDKVSDRVGNYYTVTYSTEDTTTGESHPVEIDYTGNSSNGNSLAPYNSVKFLYNQTRTYPLIAHLAGTTATTTALLTNVQSFAGASLVHDYQLQ
ncbi:MAG: SpvB/TcaC N-terminal domain-containing protein [Aliidongia sp.]